MARPGALGEPGWTTNGAAAPDCVGTSTELFITRVSLPSRYGVSPSLPVGLWGLAATVDLSE